MWLMINGKETYGGMESQDVTEVKKEEDTESLKGSSKRIKAKNKGSKSAKVEKKRKKARNHDSSDESEDGEDKSKKLSEEDLGRLLGNVSTLFGTTGGRRNSDDS